MGNIPSYPSVYNLGHRAIEGIFAEPVHLQEKVDGSQFSFGVLEGEVRARSKGRQITVESPDAMFKSAVETVYELEDTLHPGWIYRGEVLSKPHHNSLEYSRVPKGNVILFDISTDAGERYLTPQEAFEESVRIGLEFVPYLGLVKITSPEQFLEFLERDSCLGGCKIEGVVAKNYDRFCPDKHVMMGKYVSEAFKEIHDKSWGDRNPSNKDIDAIIIDNFRTEARWEKVVQHLRDDGRLLDEPKDIGPLIKELNDDILGDEEMIKDQLFKHHWKTISRGLARGFPEWYKGKLLERAFPGEISPFTEFRTREELQLVGPDGVLQEEPFTEAARFID